MTRPVVGRWGLLVGLLWAVAVAGVGGQLYRSEIDAVVVDVLVTERGRSVEGLTPQDFELRDNGVPQTVNAFAYQDSPITVVLALDVSESVSGQKLAHLRAAVDSVKGATRPGDRVALLTFSHQLHVRQAPADATGSLAGLLDDVTPEGATSLYDAALSALTVAGDRPGRRLVVVFSDGQDTTSWADPRRVLRAFERSDVVVYGVTLRDAVAATSPADAVRQAREREWFHDAPYAFGRPFLSLVTEATGGSLVVAEQSNQLQNQLLSVIGEFRERYVLAYSPVGVAPDGWHNLEVRLRQKRGTVVSRRGYLRGVQGRLR